MDDQTVSFIDPTGPYGVRRISRGEFFRRWSGCLLVTRHSLVDMVGIVVLCALLVFAGVMAWKAARWRHSPSLWIAVVAICGASFVSCSGKQHADAELQERGEMKCGLVAWSPEIDVGILPKKGDVIAEFTIENLGATEEMIELGQPDCKCASVAVDKKRLAPGDKAKVKMGIRGDRGVVGRISSRVLVCAPEHAWSRVLTITGIALGCRFSGSQHVLTGHTPFLVSGQIVTRRSDTPVFIEVTSREQPHKARFTVGAVEISKSRPLGSCFARDVSIPIRPLPKEMMALQEDQIVKVPVRMCCEGVEESQSILLLLLAPKERISRGPRPFEKTAHQ